MIFKTEIENAFHEGVGVGLDKGKKEAIDKILECEFKYKGNNITDLVLETIFEKLK